MSDETIIAGEWTVHRTNNDLRSFRIMVPDASVRAIARLRALIPELGERHPADILAEVRGTNRLDLGVIPGRNAHRLRHLLADEGWQTEVADASFISYSPVNDTHGYMKHVEQRAENERFCLRLIAEGARTSTMAEG
jgi:hypothetical protein